MSLQMWYLCLYHRNCDRNLSHGNGYLHHENTIPQVRHLIRNHSTVVIPQEVLRGSVREFQAGSQSSSTHFFKILMKECRAFSINMCLFPNLITIGTIAGPHPYMILLWGWFCSQQVEIGIKYQNHEKFHKYSFSDAPLFQTNSC